VSSTTTSRSAALVVLARSHLTWSGAIDDPYARQMLPSAWRPVESLLHLPGLRRLGRIPSFAYLAGRTRFFDQFITDALDGGIGQVVVLAAGFDSRAWRMARSCVTFYEVDLPETQASKRSMAPGPGPVYVSVDVTGPALADRLTSAGFRAGEPTAFTVEGLTMYLAEDHVARLLRTLGGLGGPGSRLAVNFGVGFENQASRRGRVGRWVMARGGERFRFRLPPCDARPFLAAAGWTVDEVLTGTQLRDRYLVGTNLATTTVTTGGIVVGATRTEL